MTTKGPLKHFNNTFHTHAKNKFNTLKNSQPQIPSKEAQASFCPSKTFHTTKRHNKMKESLVPKATMFKLSQNSKEPDQQLNSKGLGRSRFLLFVPSQHTPSPCKEKGRKGQEEKERKRRKRRKRREVTANVELLRRVLRGEHKRNTCALVSWQSESEWKR